MENEIWAEEHLIKKIRYWLIEQKIVECKYGSGAPDYDTYTGYEYKDAGKFGPFFTQAEAENLGNERQLKRRSLVDKLKSLFDETSKEFPSDLFLGESVRIFYDPSSIKYEVRKEVKEN